MTAETSDSKPSALATKVLFIHRQPTTSGYSDQWKTSGYTSQSTTKYISSFFPWFTRCNSCNFTASQEFVVRRQTTVFGEISNIQCLTDHHPLHSICPVIINQGFVVYCWQIGQSTNYYQACVNVFSLYIHLALFSQTILTSKFYSTILKLIYFFPSVELLDTSQLYIEVTCRCRKYVVYIYLLHRHCLKHGIAYNPLITYTWLLVYGNHSWARSFNAGFRELAQFWSPQIRANPMWRPQSYWIQTWWAGNSAKRHQIMIHMPWKHNTKQNNTTQHLLESESRTNHHIAPWLSSWIAYFSLKPCFKAFK